MAVLLPSRDVVLTELEKEFRRRGVPFVVHKGIGFWQRQEVRDLVNLALSLTDPSDELALFAVLRGPIGQCADGDLLFLSQLGRQRIGRGLEILARRGGELDLASAADWQRLTGPARLALLEHWDARPEEERRRLCELARWYQAWQEAVDRIPASDLLQRVLEESGAYALYAAETDADVTLANLGKLFDAIDAEEQRSQAGLARLAQRLRDLVDHTSKEEQAPVSDGRDAIQIMTVHAAKGLQFPVVAVMKLERRALRGFAPPLLVKNAWDPLLAEDAADLPDVRPGTLSVAIRHPRRPREMYTPRLLTALRSLDQAQELAESRRLFYVAATRAQERLILAARQPRVGKDGKPRKLPESWQKWFEDALRLSEDDLKQGFWQDRERGHRIAIITAVARTEPLTPAIYVPEETLDLEPLAQAVDEVFLSMDECVARLNGAEPAVESASFARAVGMLVERALRDEISLDNRETLEAFAGRLAARADSVCGAAGGLGNPSYDTRRIAERAAQVLRALRQGGPMRDRVCRLLAADGESDVPFRLALGRAKIFGMFDKLIDKGKGYEIVAWCGGPDRSTVEDARRRLLALALLRSGRAALNEGRVIIQGVSLERVEAAVAAFPAEELEKTAARWIEQISHTPTVPC
jgi:hypothetical protein